MHAGRRADEVKAEGRARLEAAALGLPSADAEQVDPRELQQQLVTLAARRVAEVTRLVSEAYLAVAADDGEAGVAEDGWDGPGVRGGARAFVGFRFTLDKDGNRVPVGEEIRGLPAYELAWADRAARYAELAIRSKLTEAQADVLAMLSGQLQGIIDGVLAGLGLDPQAPEVVAVVAERLALAAGGEPEVADGG